MFTGADGFHRHGQGSVAHVRCLPRPLAELGNVAAIAQGLRTALVCFASFAVGQWALGQLEVAVFATLTGLALCGIAHFGGTLTERFLANAIATTAGLVLAAVGTWASSKAPGLSAAVTFAVGAMVVLSALFGGYAAAGSNALILFYLVAAGSPAPLDAISGRLAGVALGGLLAAVASLSVWPAPQELTVLPLLGSALLQTGRRLLGPALTRVTVEHRGWEALTEEQLATDCALPGGYSSGAYSQGWATILARLARAVHRPTPARTEVANERRGGNQQGTILSFV